MDKQPLIIDFSYDGRRYCVSVPKDKKDFLVGAGYVQICKDILFTMEEEEILKKIKNKELSSYLLKESGLND